MLRNFWIYFVFTPIGWKAKIITDFLNDWWMDGWKKERWRERKRENNEKLIKTNTLINVVVVFLLPQNFIKTNSQLLLFFCGCFGCVLWQFQPTPPTLSSSLTRCCYYFSFTSCSFEFFVLFGVFIFCAFLWFLFK